VKDQQCGRLNVPAFCASLVDIIPNDGQLHLPADNLLGDVAEVFNLFSSEKSPAVSIFLACVRDSPVAHPPEVRRAADTGHFESFPYLIERFTAQ
jgi:hypothetical protein